VSSYRVSAQASRELLATYLKSIEFFGPKQADRYLDELHQVFALLAENPRLGRSAPRAGKDVAATSTLPTSSSIGRPPRAC
jgi:toxin ParE1/3/4